jgi:hypothetical protein
MWIQIHQARSFFNCAHILCLLLCALASSKLARALTLALFKGIISRRAEIISLICSRSAMFYQFPLSQMGNFRFGKRYSDREEELHSASHKRSAVRSGSK